MHVSEQQRAAQTFVLSLISVSSSCLSRDSHAGRGLLRESSASADLMWRVCVTHSSCVCVCVFESSASWSVNMGGGCKRAAAPCSSLRDEFSGEQQVLHSDSAVVAASSCPISDFKFPQSAAATTSAVCRPNFWLNAPLT